MRGNALTGAGYLVRGASLLTRPTLRLFVLVPLAVNILIFSAVIWWGVSFLAGWLDSIMAGIPDWLGFLEWLLWPLVGLLVTLTTGYLFTAVAIVIASPFNNLLAEKVEEMVTGREVAGLEGLGAALAGVPRGIFRELAKLLYFVPMGALVLLLTFIPGLNALSPLLWFLFGAWMFSLEFLDYPMDNHNLSFAAVRDACRERRLSSLGFGGLVALCTGIPLVNFVVVPAAVAGGTLFWVEEVAADGHLARPEKG
jgi:CysZ protein